MSDTKKPKAYIKGTHKEVLALLKRLSEDSDSLITDVTLEKSNKSDAQYISYEFVGRISAIIAFHYCKEDGEIFQGLRIYTYWKNKNHRVDFKKVNDYNRKALNGKAYIQNGKVLFETYIDISERIREEQLISNIVGWNVLAAKFFNEYLADDDDDD